MNINANMSARASLQRNYSRSMLRAELPEHPIESQSVGHFNSQIVTALNDTSLAIPTTLFAFSAAGSDRAEIHAAWQTK